MAETPLPSASFTSTEAKNEFGRVLDVALRSGAVVITKHDVPKAVLLSIEEYQALAAGPPAGLDALRAEFDAMLARMQTPESRKAREKAFAMTPKELGEAAVAAARKRG